MFIIEKNGRDGFEEFSMRLDDWKFRSEFFNRNKSVCVVFGLWHVIHSLLKRRYFRDTDFDRFHWKKVT